LSKKAKLYIVLTALAGMAALKAGLDPWQSDDAVRFICYFLISTIASGCKVNLPGVTGTMSVNFLFILIGIVELRLPETMLIAWAATLFQSFWRSKTRPMPVQILFNVSNVAIATMAAYYAYHLTLPPSGFGVPARLVLAACVYFVTNTLSVAMVISLTEGKHLAKVWKECYFWSFPYYMVGAAISGLLSVANHFLGWQTSLLIFPVIYWIYRSYRLYLGRLEDEKKHVEDMAGLHLRTIEALALAIEAKDDTTHDHLRRVEVYAVEIGRELGLSDSELQGLRAAALLHDIGKLAVPEHIISKPGRLTAVEFEKMKIHPLVGAEILEKVEFPYAVAPIVRSHHERWDGSGYPEGLAGENIPMGARILAAVDCLDALSTDRQYRRAIPLDKAMAHVLAESGSSFDPRVVEVLERRYVDIERIVNGEPTKTPRLWKNLKIERGVAPAAGFENTEKHDGQSGEGGRVDFLTSIAAARQEAQTLFELTHELGNSLSLDETLSVLALRLKRMCPYDCVAIYICRGTKLVPEYVNGDNFHLFSALEIPIGEGLSGWVAENRKPIVNGNPSVEPGYLNDVDKFSTMNSALAVPLEGLEGVVGVLTLYHAAKDAFTRDHLRILLAVTHKIALSIENALRYRQAETSAVTDALTRLPNARSLFLHLDSEVARCKRESSPLTILVCDLDGFKQVNDRFGHLEGNKVLRTVAQGLQEHCREYDYVARMGGDEFVVVLPGHPPDAVRAKARILSEIAAQAGQLHCGETLLSMSVGEAVFPEDGTDADQLLAAADRRMYHAKHYHKLTGESGELRERTTNRGLALVS
jgi:diguanylate cyclase (GGDEF)-like protein/putative nucleotidyltransferase with HDIG domain